MQQCPKANGFTLFGRFLRRACPLFAITYTKRGLTSYTTSCGGHEGPAPAYQCFRHGDDADVYLASNGDTGSRSAATSANFDERWREYPTQVTSLCCFDSSLQRGPSAAIARLLAGLTPPRPAATPLR